MAYLDSLIALLFMMLPPFDPDQSKDPAGNRADKGKGIWGAPIAPPQEASGSISEGGSGSGNESSSGGGMDKGKGILEENTEEKKGDDEMEIDEDDSMDDYDEDYDFDEDSSSEDDSDESDYELEYDFEDDFADIENEVEKTEGSQSQTPPSQMG